MLLPSDTQYSVSAHIAAAPEIWYGQILRGRETVVDRLVLLRKRHKELQYRPTRDIFDVFRVEPEIYRVSAQIDTNRKIYEEYTDQLAELRNIGFRRAREQIAARKSKLWCFIECVSNLQQSPVSMPLENAVDFNLHPRVAARPAFWYGEMSSRRSDVAARGTELEKREVEIRAYLDVSPSEAGVVLNSIELGKLEEERLLGILLISRYKRDMYNIRRLALHTARAQIAARKSEFW